MSSTNFTGFTPEYLDPFHPVLICQHSNELSKELLLNEGSIMKMVKETTVRKLMNYVYFENYQNFKRKTSKNCFIIVVSGKSSKILKKAILIGNTTRKLHLELIQILSPKAYIRFIQKPFT